MGGCEDHLGFISIDVPGGVIMSAGTGSDLALPSIGPDRLSANCMVIEQRIFSLVIGLE